MSESTPLPYPNELDALRDAAIAAHTSTSYGHTYRQACTTMRRAIKAYAEQMHMDYAAAYDHITEMAKKAK